MKPVTFLIRPTSSVLYFCKHPRLANNGAQSVHSRLLTTGTGTPNVHSRLVVHKVQFAHYKFGLSNLGATRLNNSLPSLSGLVRHFNKSSFSNSTVTSSIQQNIPGLIAKRPAKKKVSAVKPPEKEAVFEVLAYATAEEYHLEQLSAAIEQQGLYAIINLPKDADNALYVRANYKLDSTLREIYFYREGCAVFWNMPDTERNEVLKFMRKFSENIYDDGLIEQEVEKLDFIHADKNSSLQSGTIQIRESTGTDQVEDGFDDTILDKYAFSNALALSVKLGIWEASLDKFVESIEPVLEDMKVGNKIRMSKHEVLQKTGELFTLRHLINLSSDLLDPPDFYWDREHLEKLYNQTFTCLNIPKRTKVMNEKLNHCCELTDLLISHLNDNHHIRLEWMIILLIMVEVVFEIVHYIEKYSLQQEVYYTEAQTQSESKR